MPTWWDSIRSRYGDDDGPIRQIPIPRDRVDAPGPEITLEPNASYFRLWLDQMTLAKPASWGRQQFPVVNSEVRIRVAGHGDVAFAGVQRPPESALAPGVHLNYELSPLMPYLGGTVEMGAALVALPGPDVLGPIVDMVARVGGLVGPPIGQALGLAKELAGVIPQIFDANGSALLGVHRTLISEGAGGTAVMRPGSILFVGPLRDGIGTDELHVVGHQVHVVKDGRPPEPLTRHDVILLRIEGRLQRDDWLMPDIREPLTAAWVALEQKNTVVAEGYRAIALEAAHRSPEIAEGDRRRVIDGIKKQYREEAKRSGRGATGRPRPELAEIMSSLAPDREEAAALGPVSVRELFQ